MRAPMRHLFLLAAACSVMAAAPAKDVATVQDTSTRLTLPVMVNGHGPYRFVVDTGADHTVISAELAAALKLPAGRRVVMHDITGADAVDTVRIDSLVVGPHEATDVQAPVLPAASLGAAGMLGIDGMHNQHVVLDPRGGTFRIGPATPDEREGPDIVVVEGVRRFGHLVLVDAETQARPVFVILDSGAQNTIGNAALRRLVLGANGKRVAPIQIISVTGRTTPADPSAIPELRLGNVKLGSVPIAFADLHTFAEFRLQNRPAMLLGMDVLSLFRSIAIDFRRGEVVFVTR